MSDIKTIDARGLSCPQPVLLVQAAIRNVEYSTIRVLVDSGAAKDNVTRMAQKSGCSTETQEQPDGVIRITLTRKG